MFPAGSRPIRNPHGTAPGIAMDLARTSGGACRVFCLPGVPAEMKEMWPQVEQQLRAQGASGRVIRHRRIKCFGVGESDLEAMLPDLIRRGREPSVGITVSAATITLRITAAGTTPEDCLASMEPTVRTIHECLGSLVFGEEDDELEHAVVRLLQSRGETLAVLEIGTGGLISAWLREADPCGRCFRGGIVLTGGAASSPYVGQEIICRAFDAELAQVRETIGKAAQVCRENFGTDYALAVGPFPDVDDQDDSRGPLMFAVASADNLEACSRPFAGHPDILRVRAAKQGLDQVRKLLGEALRT
jgi:nicotinamide-nucleotide amidase